MPTGFERGKGGTTCECGARNAVDANFCAACGVPLAATGTSELAPSQVEKVVVAANAERQKRIFVVAASFIAISLVVAIGLTFLLRNVHIDINSNGASVELALNVCKTSVGDASETPANLPSTLQVHLASGDSTKLAFYTDNEGLIRVLAPVGWSCTAAIGADGSSSVQVSPAAQSTLGNGALPGGSTAQDVSASQTSACVGCRESLACPLFVSAASAYQSTFHQACPSRRPSSEVVTKVNGHVVEFTDPPGIHGDAAPSGGAYPAMGVMTYLGVQQSPGSWTETCLLPPTNTSMCTAILANFVSSYGRR